MVGKKIETGVIEDPKDLCPKCGAIMIIEDGQLVCPNCDGKIDYFGDEENEF
mgnify:CR=1 FL=1